MSLPNKFRGLVNCLPRGLRHEILRRSLKLNYEWPSELEAAFRLAHDEAVRTGQRERDPSGLRVLPQHLMPQSAVLIALWEEQVVGTATLIRENPMGLPLQKQVAEKIARLRGRRVAELTCLAIHERFRKGLTQVFFPMLNRASLRARPFRFSPIWIITSTSWRSFIWGIRPQAISRGISRRPWA